MGLISRVSSRTYRGIYTQRTWRYEAISKNTQSSGENCHPPWSQTPSCSDNRSSLQTPLPPSPGSGNSCLTTRRSTRRSERLSSAAKSTRNTQDALRTTVFGSGTTPGVPVRTCTESTETSRSHSPSPRCTEKWLPGIEPDQVPSRSSEPNRSNPTSADDHKTKPCTTQTSNSHSHDESCPRKPSTNDDSPPNDQTPSTKHWISTCKNITKIIRIFNIIM